MSNSSTDEPTTTVTVSEPFHRLTADDRSALVVIVTVVFSLIVAASLAAKLTVRRRVRAGFNSVDSILVGGAALAVAEAACVVYAANHGLGRHRGAADESGDEDVVRKSQYAASALGCTAIYAAKLSVCLLIKNINDHGRMHAAVRLVLGLIAVGFVSGLLATIFACPLPQPWAARDASQCPQVRVIFLYNGAMNIATDVALCGLAVGMMWPLQLLHLKDKVLVIALFMARILCPITTALSLISTEHLYQSGDFTWLAVWPTVWLQVSHHLSIITACIPNMKYIFDGLGGGFTLAVDAPYDLKTVAGKNGFLATTAVDPSGYTGLPSISSGVASRAETTGSSSRSISYHRDEEPSPSSKGHETPSFVEDEVGHQSRDYRPSSPGRTSVPHPRMIHSPRPVL